MIHGIRSIRVWGIKVTTGPVKVEGNGHLKKIDVICNGTTEICIFFHYRKNNCIFWNCTK